MEWISNNFPLLFTSLVGIGTTITTYVTTRQNKALKEQLLAKEVESNALDVVAKNMGIYQDMMDDIKKRFESTINEYRSDVERLKLLLEESRAVIGRQEQFLKEKNIEINALRILVDKYNLNSGDEKF